MEAGSWKLPAGMVLGLAGVFLLRPVIVTDRGELRLLAERGSTEADAAGSEALAGKSEASPSGKRSAGSPLARLSSGDAVTDVRELIASLEAIEAETHYNPMVMIRRMYLLTQLWESEVMDVLASLSKQEEAGKDGPDLVYVATVILSRLAALNGPEALRLLSSDDHASIWDGSENDLVVSVMDSWVAADPEGAKRWFEATMKPSDLEVMNLMENNDFRQAYYDAMAKHDPEALAREIADNFSDWAWARSCGQLVCECRRDASAP